MDKSTFAACMKRNREKHKITYEALSNETGIPIDKLIDFESGEFDCIKASELKDIAKAINVPPLSLMHGGGTVHYLHRFEDDYSYCEWVEY